MAHVAGIVVEKPAGKKHYARIDLEKHPAVKNYLEKVGAIEEDDFEERIGKAVPFEDARKRTLEYVKELFDDK